MNISRISLETQPAQARHNTADPLLQSKSDSERHALHAQSRDNRILSDIWLIYCSTQGLSNTNTYCLLSKVFATAVVVFTMSRDNVKIRIMVTHWSRFIASINNNFSWGCWHVTLGKELRSWLVFLWKTWTCTRNDLIYEWTKLWQYVLKVFTRSDAVGGVVRQKWKSIYQEFLECPCFLWVLYVFLWVLWNLDCLSDYIII